MKSRNGHGDEGTKGLRQRWPHLVTFSLCHLVTAFGVVAAVAAEPAGLAFHVAKLVAMDDTATVINDAVVLVKDGRIEALGPADQVRIPQGYRLLDFPAHWLVPGIVEAHNHSVSGSWSDLNDMVYQTNPGLDTRSIAPPDNDWVKQARRGGVTTVLLLPGSGTNMAGFGTVVSTGGHTPDEITMRSPGSLKIAQAGNPEWYFGGNGRSFMNWNTRQTLEKARAYHDKWTAWEQAKDGSGPKLAKPEFDPMWDALRGVFRGDYPVANHTQIYQVLMTTIDMFGRRQDAAKGPVEQADEGSKKGELAGEHRTKFGLWTITEHSCFDAWKVAPLVLETDVWTIQGPRQYHFDRTAARMIGNANGWWKNGVHNLGINTDAPVIPQEELTYQSTMACWYGWLPYPALRAITNITAKSIGVYDRVGSVEPGKQADLTIWTGDPIDPRSACLMTVVKGKIIYDGTHELRRF